jgi:hypothetical protein
MTMLFAFRFLSEVPSALDNPAGYGIIAGSMVMGAGLYHQWVGKPLRADKEKAETRAEKAETEKTEAYKSTLPALASAEALADRVLAVIPDAPGRRRSRQGSET